jgi:hypothetical protein
MKKKWIIPIVIIGVAALLAGAWFLSGNEDVPAPSLSASASPSPEVTPSPSPVETEPSPSESAPIPSATASQTPDNHSSPEPSESVATPTPSIEPSAPPAGSPSPKPTVPSAESTASSSGPEGEKQAQCTILVECTQVLSAMDSLKEEKYDIIPKDGIILQEQTIDLTEGDTPFDILRRETKRNKIQMKFSKTPLTGTVYVEGIGNLNEFDCGGTSGWMFSVNGEVPSVSAGEYVLKDGDIVRWYYSLSENAGGLE